MISFDVKEQAIEWIAGARHAFQALYNIDPTQPVATCQLGGVLYYADEDSRLELDHLRGLAELMFREANESGADASLLRELPCGIATPIDVSTLLAEPSSNQSDSNAVTIPFVTRCSFAATSTSPNPPPVEGLDHVKAARASTRSAA